MTQVLSLFSGCGGLDLGFVQAGGEVAAAYEFDPKACAGYERVMGHSIEQSDLIRIDAKSLPDTEGIIGGPPCQPFSLSTSQLTNMGPSSVKNLWPQTLDIVRIKRPEWFVFENVKHLVYARRSRAYFHGLLDSLTSYGYRVEYRILNAADYGVPQTRERVFVVGRLDGQAWRWPVPTHKDMGDMFSHRWMSWKSALGDWRDGAQLADIPAWILKRDLYANGWNTDAYFNTQEARHTLMHRDGHRPAFTVTGGSSGRIRIVWDGKVYRGDKRATARLQTLPDGAQLTDQCIGNAVPPLLAKAVFEAAFEREMVMA
jgi:DNA (cytosine-5)-methyltransferase 1